MKVQKKIYALRTKHDMPMQEFANLIGASAPAIHLWETGKRSPKMEYILAICERFGLDIARFIDETNDYYDNDLPNNVTPMPRLRTIPLIGDIACGTPNLATEDAQESVFIPEWVNADFALRCKGDSMINARIHDGDIVFIKEQPDVENGEIAAVRIDDEATLKRVYKKPGYILLQPENPAYEPIILTPEEMETVRIIGKAVAFVSSVR